MFLGQNFGYPSTTVSGESRPNNCFKRGNLRYHVFCAQWVMRVSMPAVLAGAIFFITEVIHAMYVIY